MDGGRMNARALAERVGAVLWEVWDPIGVNAVPETRDEYESYAPELARMLGDGASDEALAAHLRELAEGFGVAWVDPERTRRTVAALRALGEG
jgi:hypothetical protein